MITTSLISPTDEITGDSASDLRYLFGHRPRPVVPFLSSARQCSRVVDLRCRMAQPYGLSGRASAPLTSRHD
jgi:hypothetical protein